MNIPNEGRVDANLVIAALDKGETVTFCCGDGTEIVFNPKNKAKLDVWRNDTVDWGNLYHMNPAPCPIKNFHIEQD
jgi:lysyl-tRNA synthetase class I